MKSKRLIWAFLLTAIGLIMPTSLFADSFTDENGNVINYGIYNGAIEITGLSSLSEDEEKAGHLIIPSTITIGEELYTVKEIAYNAFNNNGDILFVGMPNALYSGL